MQRQKFQRTTYVALTLVLISLTLASTAWAVEYKVLYKFQSGGHFPFGDLTFDAAGNLYGTTVDGGYGGGTVFKLTPNPDGSWTESVIHSFSGADGQYPYAGLIFDAAGNLYGTTSTGGAYRQGTVFKLTPNPDGSWTESVIYSFSGADGAGPYAGLIFDAAGNLYSTTRYGGAYGQGTAFKLTPSPDGSWTRAELYAFRRRHGKYPDELTFDAAGNLYGTTSWGGAYKGGTVFKLTPNPDGSWSESVIYSFTLHTYPTASPIVDAAGNLYGITRAGGVYDRGTVFKLSPNPDGSWTKVKLHAFKGPDGVAPAGGLIFDAAGNLYGTTESGGAYDQGTAFKLTPNPDGSWTRAKLHAFKGSDGRWPWGRLIVDAAGNLYGTTVYGGLGYGVVFRITP